MSNPAKVYFSREITPEKVLEMYKLAGKEVTGSVAIKVHSGEPGNQNFLHPEFWKPVIDHVGGTVVECNTAYEGRRQYTRDHVIAIKEHGWNDYFDFDLLDAEDTLAEAQDTVAGAEIDLFTAYNNYCWAVERGILN